MAAEQRDSVALGEVHLKCEQDRGLNSISIISQLTVVYAFVVPTQMGAFNGNEVRSLFQNELGRMKTPKYGKMHESIPKTSTGKSIIQNLSNTSKNNDS